MIMLSLSRLVPRFCSRQIFTTSMRSAAVGSGEVVSNSGESSNANLEPEHIISIVQQISQLKFHEVAILNEALKRELKIPDVTRVAAGPAVAAADGDQEAEAKGATKSAYTVKLVKFDDSKKVALIKEIKKLVQGINLVEAKRFVEELPKVIGSNMSKDEAETLQKQLEAAGGVVKLD